MSNFLVWMGFTILISKDIPEFNPVLLRGWFIVGVLSVVIDVIRVARSLIVVKED